MPLTILKTSELEPSEVSKRATLTSSTGKKVAEIINEDSTAEGMRASILQDLRDIFAKLDPLSTETKDDHGWQSVRLQDFLFTYNADKGAITVEQYTTRDQKVIRKGIYVGSEKHLDQSIVEVQDNLSSGSVFHLVKTGDSYGVKENKIPADQAIRRLKLCIAHISNYIDRSSQ